MTTFCSAKWADLALNTSPARPSVMPLLPYVRRALPGQALLCRSFRQPPRLLEPAATPLQASLCYYALARSSWYEVAGTRACHGRGLPGARTAPGPASARVASTHGRYLLPISPPEQPWATL
jgi:hypothetical protein